MTKFWKITNLIVLGLLVLICVFATLTGRITFGLGLGDMVGYFFLYVGTLIHLVITYIIRRKGKISHSISSLVFLNFTFIIVLFATIWRGSEYKWDGNIFYLPCSSKITVQNKNVEKTVLVQMCTMEYHSEFTGNWDGKHMVINDGEIKVPNELEKYIVRPITKIEIKPDYYEIFENEELSKVFNFNADTLSKERMYKITGEIEGIRNSIPVMKVYIK
jgi:hypothetical protein